MAPNTRFISPDPEGGWDVKKPGASRASSHHDTQAEAQAAAHRYLHNEGRGGAGHAGPGRPHPRQEHGSARPRPLPAEGLGVALLYTKEGRPLRRSGSDTVCAVGTTSKLKGKKAHGRDGRYVGTLVGNRLVHRSTDSATNGSPFAQRAHAGTAIVAAAGAAFLGDEPPIPD